MASWCALLYSLSLVSITLFLLSRLIRWNYDYWIRKGVPGPKPTFILGNVGPTFLQKESLGETFLDIYCETKKHPFVGAYMLFRRTLVVNDFELIRNVLVRDFAHFTDHSAEVSEKAEPLSAHLFNLTGEKWKNLRHKLSPTFTSSKIRYMFDTMAQCSTEMILYLTDSTSEEASFDVKDLIAKLNTDVIGSCAFGLECNTFKYPDTEFRRIGRKVVDLVFRNSLLQFLVFFMPLKNFLNVSILGNSVTQFFYNTVKKTMTFRKENNIVRDDFMQLLIQLKNDGYVEDHDSGTGSILFASSNCCKDSRDMFFCQ